MKATLTFFIFYIAQLFIAKITQYSGKNTFQLTDIWSDTKFYGLIPYI